MPAIPGLRRFFRLPSADRATQDVVDINSCGLALRSEFGFPDANCPHESPMAELDGEILAMPALASEPAAAVPGELPDASSMGEEPAQDAGPATR